MRRGASVLFVLASSGVSCALLTDIGNLPYPPNTEAGTADATQVQASDVEQPDVGLPDVDVPDAQDAAAPDADAADGTADANSNDGHVPTCIWKDTKTGFVDPAGAPAITVNAPMNAPGDVMIAVLGLGLAGNTAVPVFTPPPGWNLLAQADHGTTMSLRIYGKTAGATEAPSYRFDASKTVSGVAWISTYSSVDSVQPVDVEGAQDWPGVASTVAAPRLVTTGASELLLLTYLGYYNAAPDGGSAWTTTSGTVAHANLGNGGSRCGLGEEFVQPAPGQTPIFTATANTQLAYALTHTLALRCQ